MTDKPCHECGTEMIEEYIGYTPDDNGEDQVVETHYFCPGCGHEEETYDA